MQDVKVISKMSMATIKANAKKFATEEGTPIAVVYGQASGIKETRDKITDNIYHALTGTFEAINLNTKDVYASGVLYLPSGIHEIIEAPVKGLTVEGDYVQFALEMRAVTAKNLSGFSYEGKNVIPSKQVDPLDEMRAALGIGEGLKVLEAGAAPTQAPDEEPEAEEPAEEVEEEPEIPAPPAKPAAKPAAPVKPTSTKPVGKPAVAAKRR